MCACVIIRLLFRGEILECLNCVEEPTGSSMLSPHWTMPLSKLGERRYYLGTFFKVNCYFFFYLKNCQNVQDRICTHASSSRLIGTKQPSFVAITVCSWPVLRPNRRTINLRNTSKSLVINSQNRIKLRICLITISYLFSTEKRRQCIKDSATNISGRQAQIKEKKVLSSGYRPDVLLLIQIGTLVNR